MLPIGAKPALELIVDEAKSAGADEIVMVISKGKELIREYFKDDPAVRFVYQLEQKGLGHAVLQAAEACGGVEGNVLVLLGDALVAGCNAAQAMVALSAAHGGAGVVGLEHVPAEKISRYGIVKLEGNRIVDLVEKPAPEDAPSDLAIAGRYLLPAEIFDYLRTQAPGKGGEIQLTDAIRRMIVQSNNQAIRPSDSQTIKQSSNQTVRQSDRQTIKQSNNQTIKQSNNLIGYVYPGRRQDIGNPQGYLNALLAMKGE